MAVHQKKVLEVLASTKEDTVPSKKSFDETWNAIPAYREHMKHDVMARSSYTIDEHILAFLKSRLNTIQTMTVDGFTIVIEYVYSTGKYIMRVCEKALDSVMNGIDKD